MIRLTNVPQAACPVSSEKGEVRLMAYQRPNLGVALYAYIPDGSRLPIVEVGGHISHALAKLARNPQVQPWRSKLLAAAETLLAN